MRVAPRPNLSERILESGFTFSSLPGDEPYWDESACYVFGLGEIEDDLEAPTAELAALCIAFVERAVADEALFVRLDLPMALQDCLFVRHRAMEILEQTRRQSTPKA